MAEREITATPFQVGSALPNTRARLISPRLTPLLSHVAHFADPAPYGLIGLALVMVALARRRARVALAIAVVLICSEVTTEALKPLLSHPRPQEWLGKG